MNKINTIMLVIVLYVLMQNPILFASENQLSKNIPETLLRKEPESIDIRFLISASEIQNQKKLGQKGFIFIDIRSTSSFRKVRIFDSINIPLFAIITKDFLKTKTLILVNEGFGYKSLIHECGRLKKNGFKSVYILKGGLNAWYKSGGYIEGNYFAKRDLNIITPNSFFQDKDYANIIVINIYRSDIPEPKSLIPETINIPFSGSISKLIEDLKRTIISNKKDVLLYLLISDGYKLISKHIKEIDKNISDTIVYLKGGTQAYNEFLKKQTLIWVPKKQKKAGKKCSFCD